MTPHINPNISDNAHQTITNKLTELNADREQIKELHDLFVRILKAPNIKRRLSNEIYSLANKLKGIDEQIRTLNNVLTSPNPVTSPVSTPIKEHVRKRLSAPAIKVATEYRPKNRSNPKFKKIPVQVIKFTNGNLNPTAVVELMIRRAPRRFNVNDMIMSLREAGLIIGSVSSDKVAKTVYRVLSIAKRNNILNTVEGTKGQYEKVTATTN